MIEGIIRHRRSTRHFTQKSVSQKDLLSLVEAGTWAPSGSNTQNQRFLILTDPNALRKLDEIRFVWPYKAYSKRLAESDRTGIIANAAAVIAVFADASKTGTANGSEYYVWQSLDTQNCSAAIENILLLATAMGLGTCWVSATEAMSHSRLLLGQSWREAFDGYAIPPDYHIQGLVLVGYARKTDSDGFPAGEGMHGTDWTPTERAPADSYLIDPAETLPRNTLKPAKQLGLRLLVAAIKGLLSIVRRLERMVYRIEVSHLTSTRGGSSQ